MFCPNCGTKTSSDLKFCRSCGLALEKTVQSLAEQLPSELDRNLESEKDRLQRLGVAALGVFFAGILGFLLYSIIYKTMFLQGRTWEGVALLVFVVIGACGLLSVYLFAKANDAADVANKRRIQASELPERQTTGKLLTDVPLEPVPSVTERTTALLTVEKKKGEGTEP